MGYELELALANYAHLCPILQSVVLLWPQQGHLHWKLANSINQAPPTPPENSPLPGKQIHRHTTDSNPGSQNSCSPPPGHSPSLSVGLCVYGVCVCVCACVRAHDALPFRLPGFVRNPHSHTESSDTYGMMCLNEQKHQTPRGKATDAHLQPTSLLGRAVLASQPLQTTAARRSKYRPEMPGPKTRKEAERRRAWPLGLVTSGFNLQLQYPPWGLPQVTSPS